MSGIPDLDQYGLLIVPDWKVENHKKNF